MKFRKKPVVIEAINVDTALVFIRKDQQHVLSDWLRKALEKGVVTLTDDSLYIRTLEGVMKASVGDWIICGVQGEIYPCKPDIFAATYEPAA